MASEDLTACAAVCMGILPHDRETTNVAGEYAVNRENNRSLWALTLAAATELFLPATVMVSVNKHSERLLSHLLGLRSSLHGEI